MAKFIVMLKGIAMVTTRKYELPAGPASMCAPWRAPFACRNIAIYRCMGGMSHCSHNTKQFVINLFLRDILIYHFITDIYINIMQILWVQLPCMSNKSWSCMFCSWQPITIREVEMKRERGTSWDSGLTYRRGSVFVGWCHPVLYHVFKQAWLNTLAGVERWSRTENATSQNPKK